METGSEDEEKGRVEVEEKKRSELREWVEAVLSRNRNVCDWDHEALTMVMLLVEMTSIGPVRRVKFS